MKDNSHRSTMVYRIYDAEGVLLYVGMTYRKLSRRMISHRRWQPWATEIATVTSEWYENRQLAAEAERKAIQTERPKYNKQNTGSYRTPLRYRA